MRFFIALFFLTLSVVLAFRPRSGVRALSRPTVQRLHATPWTSLIEAAAKPEGYVYGAVEAPGWALPLGLVLIVSVAAVPLLLAPGEKALDAQRENEDIKGVKFGRKQKDEV